MQTDSKYNIMTAAKKNEAKWLKEHYYMLEK